MSPVKQDGGVGGIYMRHIRFVQQYHRCSGCWVQPSPSSPVWRRRPPGWGRTTLFTGAVLFKISIWRFARCSGVYRTILWCMLIMHCGLVGRSGHMISKGKKTTTTYQLNKRQSSIAVGHDEDIPGFCFGHKVVPHVHHVFLGRSVFLQWQKKNVFWVFFFFYN